MFRQQIRLSLFAVLAAFTLALTGCGGGGGGNGDDGMMPEPPDPQMVCEDAGGRYNQDGTCTSAADLMAERQQDQRDAISTAIGDATTAVNAVNNDSTDAEVSAADTAIADARTAIADAADLPQAEKDANSGTVNALATQLSGAKTARMNAMDDADRDARIARKAMAAKLYAGLATEDAAATTPTNALNAATISIMGMDLSGDADGTGAGEPVTLKRTDTSVPSLHGWAGTDYVRTTTSPALTDHAVIYSNRGAPTTALFATKYSTELAAGTAGRLDNDVLITADSQSIIMSNVFASGSGFMDHTESAGDVVKIRGTYDGGMGYYHCAQSGTANCRSRVNGTGGILLEGGWSFEPDEGIMAMTADAEYVIFGWWSREVAAGVDVATFAQRVGGTTDLAGAANNALTGTATYIGGAAGKYSINEPVDGDPNAGAFTARAELTARFGNATDGGTISGMLSGFMTDHGAKDWTVTLKGTGANAGAAIEDGGFGAVAENLGQTVWTINGEAGDAGESWSGDFYYESATQQSAANTPPTAAGTFSATHSNVGRMVGAFGATKE